MSKETPPPGVKLPKGSKYLPVLRAHFNRQSEAAIEAIHRRIVGKSPRNLDPIFVPGDFFDPDEWDESLAADARPVTEFYWDESGQRAMVRYGLSPAAFSVRPPGVQAAIDNAAFSLSRSVNQTTWKRMGEVVEGLKTELAQGLFEGDTHEELIDRVQGVFTEASEYRANVIAQTEASRAIHAGQLEAAKQSDGVVIGKRFLLSGSPCPLCVAVAEKNMDRVVPLEGSFARVGDHPDYAEIITPPVHPGCLCSMEEVLAPEMQTE